MESNRPICPECQTTLMLTRAWRTVYWSCTGCGTGYPLARFIHLMDEAMEQELAAMRVDRL